MALGEDVVDLVGRLPPVAGRLAGPARRGELRGFCRLPPHPPPGHATGLAGKILKGRLEGLEPAAKACRSDQATRAAAGVAQAGVLARGSQSGNLAPRKGCKHPPRGVFGGCSAPGKNAFVAEPEGGRRRSAAFSDSMSLGHETRRRHLHHQPPSRNDNEAPDGSQRA